MRKFWGLALPAAMVAGCVAPGVPAPASPAPGRYGLEPEQSVEVCRPEGERRYLARLICPSGQHPTFERAGNVGPRTPLPLDMSPAEQERLLADNMAMKPLSEGEVDHHWIDAYEVVCESQTTTIYMDMYHCSADAPAQAPANFRIIR